MVRMETRPCNRFFEVPKPEQLRWIATCACVVEVVEVVIALSDDQVCYVDRVGRFAQTQQSTVSYV